MSDDSNSYDEREVLTQYIWGYYHHLMSDFEKEVSKAMLGRAKAHGASSQTTERKMLERWGQVNYSSINEALSDGHDAFRRRTVERLMAEHRNDIYINRCPKCNRIVRTPRAKQCQWCYHDWHGN